VAGWRIWRRRNSISVCPEDLLDLRQPQKIRVKRRIRLGGGGASLLRREIMAESNIRAIPGRGSDASHGKSANALL
jgi:hypothetical protein